MPTKLKMEKIEGFVVQSYDLEDVIREVYEDKKFCFSWDQDCLHGNLHRFSVDGKLSEPVWGDIKKIQETKEIPEFSTSILLNHLCYNGVIPVGEYIIVVYDEE